MRSDWRRWSGMRGSSRRSSITTASDWRPIVSVSDGQSFAKLVDGTAMRVLLSPDFNTLAWRKLLINGVANPITALTLQRQAVFRRDDVKALCLAVLGEAAAVGRADGARLADDEPERVLATLLTYPADAGTSMYFDRLKGRPFEVEALTGAIVAAGERHHVPTPLNRMLLTLLRATSDGLSNGKGGAG